GIERVHRVVVGRGAPVVVRDRLEDEAQLGAARAPEARIEADRDDAQAGERGRGRRPANLQRARRAERPLVDVGRQERAAEPGRRRRQRRGLEWIEDGEIVGLRPLDRRCLPNRAGRRLARGEAGDERERLHRLTGSAATVYAPCAACGWPARRTALCSELAITS